MTPKGGTELQHGFLTERVDSKLLDHFQICTSVPEKIPLDLNKINILWQKNAADQPNIKPWFENKENHNLKCHYCGYEQIKIDKCSKCNSNLLEI